MKLVVAPCGSSEKNCWGWEGVSIFRSVCVDRPQENVSTYWPKYQDTFSTSTVLFRTTTWCYRKLHLIIWRHHGKLPKSYQTTLCTIIWTSFTLLIKKNYIGRMKCDTSPDWTVTFSVHRNTFRLVTYIYYIAMYIISLMSTTIS